MNGLLFSLWLGLGIVLGALPPEPPEPECVTDAECCAWAPDDAFCEPQLMLEA